MGWWASPENETVPEVLETWLNRGVHQSLENRVQNQARMFGGKELSLLLSIASIPMGRVPSLQRSLET
jgi:hypothetical protein